MKDLKKYNQEHIIKYIDELSDVERNSLLNQIDKIDFESLSNIYNNRNKKVTNTDNVIKPLEPVILDSKESKRLFNVGLESIKNNEVAVVLMAGGQGTRLGHDGPKGTYDIGLPSKKSLFNIQSDKLKIIYKLTGVCIKWYIMTSEDNYDETIRHFRENNFFDYYKDFVVFFKQDQLPLVLENGMVSMKSKFEINMAANGNGGVFSSLKNNGILSEMKSNGVKWVFLYGVDNILVKVADPTFVGLTIESGLQIASKAVNKMYPEERVGVICYRNNHPDIVEYSELDENLANEYDENNLLKYRNANIVSHIFSLDFLLDCSEKELPYHTAFKKVDNFKDNKIFKAIEPNGYKYELFMFDVFKFTNDMAVLTVNREEEFAPVKNKDGNDSPESARKLVLELHKKWLKSAGYIFDDMLEVKSDLSYNGENLQKKKLEDITE